MPNTSKEDRHFITSELQIDLATAVARLEQLEAETPDTTMHDFLLHRLLSCDLPRLRGYLQPELSGLVLQVRETFQFVTPKGSKEGG